MKIDRSHLKQLVKEEIQRADPLLIGAIANLTDKIEHLDISIDYLAAATIGIDPQEVGFSQKTLGRVAKPSRMPSSDLKENKLEKIIKAIIKEELQ